MNERAAFTTAEPPPSCDVLVLGSGAAGLVAACRAADAGHDVLLVERTDRLGGTTAVSGGVLWVPGNHLMAAGGFSDTRQDALAYLTAVTRGGMPRERDQWFLDTAPEAVRYLCDETDVGLAALGRPDYRADLPGTVSGGRTLDNLPFDTGAYPASDRCSGRPPICRRSPCWSASRALDSMSRRSPGSGSGGGSGPWAAPSPGRSPSPPTPGESPSSSAPGRWR